MYTVMYNDPDGNVKMLCGGSVESVNELFHAIQTRAPPGISIGQFVKDEIITDIDLNLPPEFLKLEDWRDIRHRQKTGQRC